MKLPKAVKEAFEEFDKASQEFAQGTTRFVEGRAQFKDVVLLEAARDATKKKLFEEINKMCRNDRRRKDG